MSSLVHVLAHPPEAGLTHFFAFYTGQYQTEMGRGIVWEVCRVCTKSKIPGLHNLCASDGPAVCQSAQVKRFAGLD